MEIFGLFGLILVGAGLLWMKDSLFTKRCKYCQKAIDRRAIKCPFCQSELARY
jgi:hypothetical protein